MTADDILQVIEANVRHTQDQGNSSIPVANLLAYLKQLQKDVETDSKKTDAMTSIELENLKARLNQWLDDQKREHELRLEFLRAVISTGQAALKSALIINGGATVALLAFLGHIWSSSEKVIPLVTHSIFLYTLGVFSAACAAGFTYISQAGYGDEFGKSSQEIGKIGHAAAISSTLCAYGLFLKASIDAATALGLQI